MADKTGIEWTDATWNPVTGCTKVSQGCKNCYAKHQAWPRLKASPGTVYFGREFENVAWHPGRLRQPLQWKRPRRIFVNSMSDLFHEDVPDMFILAVFAVMETAQQHTFQILTKRPERMRRLLSVPSFYAGWMRKAGLDIVGPKRYGSLNPGWPLPNVWLGVSVEDQATADERLPPLLETPAALRWISAEPLLGPIDLSGLLTAAQSSARRDYLAMRIGEDLLDWVVVGGESGKEARPMNPVWARTLRDQCKTMAIPFLFKQWGEWREIDDGQACRVCGCTWNFACPGGCSWIERDLCSACEGLPTPATPPSKFRKVGKRNAGRELDGREWNEYPQQPQQ